jgi:cytochrome c553
MVPQQEHYYMRNEFLHGNAEEHDTHAHFRAIPGRLKVAVFAFGLSMASPGVLWAQPGDAAVEDSMHARVLACTPCHGPQGGGTNNDYFPRLAGKPAGYLMNQLVAFRNGRRRYPPMNYLLEFQPDTFLKEIAKYYAEQRPPLAPRPVPSVSPAILANGKLLVTEGDSAHGIPACAGCHNPSFTGMEPGIPGLVGLRSAYITAQLGAWRYGTRTAISPDCMQIVAGRLTEGDVAAVAAYLSSLPIPPDPAPVAQGALPMPLACGSEPP